MKPMSLRAAGVLADSINDTNSTRKVYMLAGGLALLGIALIVITVWFWRSTRHDPELLGPLEVMGDRKFKRLEGTEQKQLLDGKRPTDAEPKEWGVQRGGSTADAALVARAHEGGVEPDVADSDVVDAVRSAALSDAAAHAELDSILLAAGAVVPGMGSASTSTSTPSDVDDVDIDKLLGIGAHATAAAPDGAVAWAGGTQTEVDDDVTNAVVRPEVVDPEPVDGASASVLPGTVEPAVDESKVDESKVDESKVDESKVDESKVGASASALPGTGAPAVDESKVDESKVDGSKVDGSKVDESKVDEPRIEPLVIVPVDHDLRPSSTTLADSLHSEAASGMSDTHDPRTAVGRNAADGPGDQDSIDPLLRMLNRNDG